MDTRNLGVDVDRTIESMYVDENSRLRVNSFVEKKVMDARAHLHDVVYLNHPLVEAGRIRTHFIQ